MQVPHKLGLTFRVIATVAFTGPCQRRPASVHRFLCYISAYSKNNDWIGLIGLTIARWRLFSTGNISRKVLIVAGMVRSLPQETRVRVGDREVPMSTMNESSS